MNFKIGTAKMNSILSKAAKGVGDNKILPITSYLEIELVQGGTLLVTATNGVNFITCLEPEVEGDPGKVIVKADLITKLVSRTTTPVMEFALKGDYLEVRGNGVYKLPLFETNEYPTYEFNHDAPAIEVDTAALKNLFRVGSAAIAKEMLMPCLTGYNIGRNTITTDAVKMCINNLAILPGDERMLLPQSLADLVSLLTDEKVKIQRDGNKVLFTTSNVIIYGVELDGIEQYPDVTPILQIKYGNYAIVNKSELMGALERLSLFVDQMSNHGVRLVFTSDALVLLDFQENSEEVVAYVEKSLQAPGIEVVVNIDFLSDLLAVVSGDKVRMQFGEGQPLCITEEGVTMVLSTMEG